MAQLYFCGRFQTMVITMISGDGTWGIGWDGDMCARHCAEPGRVVIFSIVAFSSQEPAKIIFARGHQVFHSAQLSHPPTHRRAEPVSLARRGPPDLLSII